MNRLLRSPKPAAYQPAFLANNLWPLLMLLFVMATAVSSLHQTSPTYDEHEYLARGYLYLKTGDTRLKLRHPILLDTLAAAPLLLLPGIELPLDHPSLEAGDFHRYAAVFFWERNEELADQMIFLARLPTIFLLLLLVTAIYHWTRLRFGREAALVALVLASLDPNLLAHGRLVTPDAGQTTFIFISIFAWWLYLQRPSWQQGLWAGLILGLAQTAGFPALLLYPVLFLVTAAYGWKGRSPLQQGTKMHSLPKLLAALAGISLLSLLVIWAVYGFSWGKVEPLGWSLPAPYHWTEFLDLWQRLGRQDLAYLNGEVYRGGRFTFFLIALFIKTPIPTLLLAGTGVWYLWRHTPLADMALWLLPVLYYANALISSLNIGYRHILPMLPFMFVWAGCIAARVKTRQHQLILAGLCGWLFITSWSVYPHYLAYFNELVGGPNQGRFHLTVSDLDWGQDLGNLARYLQTGDIEQVYLSYFGTAPPEHYGIHYQPLPAWPPRGNAAHHLYHPQFPPPGTYAISAANLMGARFEDAPDTFAWFWQQEPQAEIGHSILVYDVPRLLDPAAAPVNLALADVSLKDLPGSFFEDYFHTNDVRVRWFSSQKAIVLPAGEAAWLISAASPFSDYLGEDQAAVLPPVVSTRTANGETWTLYAVREAEVVKDYLAVAGANLFYLPDQTTLRNEPVSWGGTLSFLGYAWMSGATTPGSTVQLLTYWQVEAATSQALAFFVHFRGEDGRILAQHDGMDVVSQSWHQGDLLIQLHELTLPATLPATDAGFALGVYDAETLGRLPIIVGGQTLGDHLLLPKPDQ